MGQMDSYGSSLREYMSLLVCAPMEVQSREAHVSISYNRVATSVNISILLTIVTCVHSVLLVTT